MLSSVRRRWYGDAASDPGTFEEVRGTASEAVVLAMVDPCEAASSARPAKDPRPSPARWSIEPDDRVVGHLKSRL